MSKKDLAATPLDGLRKLEKETRKAQRTLTGNSSVLNRRLRLDILKAIDLKQQAMPAPAPAPTAWADLDDDELVERLRATVAKMPEHVLTHLQTAIDERRRGPVLVEESA
jgi:hypothetical protein